MRGFSRLLPQTEQLVLIACFVALFQPLFDPDTFMHLATGRYVQRAGIPHVDPFSHTIAGKEWLAHEWLAATAMEGLYRAGDLSLLVWVTATMGALSMWLVLHLVTLQGVVSPLARILSLIVAFGFMRSTVVARPHMVTMVSLPLLAVLLQRYRDGGRARWLIPVPLIFVIWANCHGGFILGAIPFLAAAVDLGLSAARREPDSSRRLGLVAAVGIASLLAATFNPHGVTLLTFPLTFQPGARFLKPVLEWQSPNLHNSTWAWVSLVALLGLHLRQPAGSPGSRVALAAALVLTVQAVRNFFLFSIFGVPLMAAGFAREIESRAWLRRIDAWMAPWNESSGRHALLAVAAASTLLWSLPKKVVDPRWFPEAAVVWLRERRPPGLLFNEYNQGGYLIWTLESLYPVFIDGRIDTYHRHAALRDYLTISDVAPGWDRVLDRHGVNIVLVHDFRPLAGVLRSRPGWRLVFSGDGFVIFMRETPIPAGRRM